MTKYVREYQIPQASQQTIEMSKGAAIFHVENCEGLIVVFASFDSDAPVEERRIYMLYSYEWFEPSEPIRHIGTVKNETDTRYLHVLVSIPVPVMAPAGPMPVPMHMLPPEMQEMLRKAQEEAEKEAPPNKN